MGNMVSAYTAAQRYIMFEELSRSIREHGFSTILDLANFLVRTRELFCVSSTVASTSSSLHLLENGRAALSELASQAHYQGGSNNRNDDTWFLFFQGKRANLRTLERNLGYPSHTHASQVLILSEAMLPLLCSGGKRNRIASLGGRSANGNGSLRIFDVVVDAKRSPEWAFEEEVTDDGDIPPPAKKIVLEATEFGAQPMAQLGDVAMAMEPIVNAKRSREKAFGNEDGVHDDGYFPPAKKIVLDSEATEFGVQPIAQLGDVAMAMEPIVNAKRSREKAFGNEDGGHDDGDFPPAKKIVLEATEFGAQPKAQFGDVAMELSANMIALGGNVAAARVPADAAHRASTVLYMTSHFSLSAKKGITGLSWEMLNAISKFLPREDWGSLALTCRRFRMDLTGMVLCEERVVSSVSDDPETWKLRFATLRSFSILNRHWRLGPLFQPIDRATFSFPYDDEERNRCLQLALEFFQSLAPGIQHIQHVYLSLGIIWDTGDMSPSIDYVLFRSLLREIYRSGCKNLTIMSIDAPGQPNREDPGPDILLNVQDEQIKLEHLSVESNAFSSPALTPWFMKQVLESSSISYLRLSGTGFTAAQLDTVLCYVRLPQLEDLVIGDAWLASVIELLRGSPRLRTVHFLELSPDLRVPNGMFVPLPALHSIHGNSTTLSHFIPLLRNVPWDSFMEVDIATNMSEGPDDTVVHTFDAVSTLDIMELLVANGAELETLAIAFPSLADFSLPFFEENVETIDILHLCRINHLRIQLRCNGECENGQLMDALIPWICHFHSIKSVFLYSIGPRIPILDKFAFRANLFAIRPDLDVKVGWEH